MTALSISTCLASSLASDVAAHHGEAQTYSVSLSVGTVKGAPGQEVVIPISLANSDSVVLKSLEIICSYDPSVLSVRRVQNGTAIGADWFTATEIGSNYVGFSAYNLYGSSAIAGDIFYIRVLISDSASIDSLTAIHIFNANLVDAAGECISIEITHGGVEVVSASQVPTPITLFSDPLEQFLFDNLYLDPSSGLIRLAIPSATPDSTTDAIMAAKVRKFIDLYKQSLTFTDGIYAPDQDSYRIDNAEYFLVVRIANDASIGDGPSVHVDTSGNGNTILLVAAGNGGTDSNGGSALGVSGSGSVVIVIGGNGGESKSTHGGKGGNATGGFTLGSADGQAFSVSGNGGNGGNGKRGGDAGCAKCTGNSNSDLRSVGGCGGNGGDGAEGGHGGKGGDAKVAVCNDVIPGIARATGGNGGKGGDSHPSKRGGHGGRGGNAITCQATEDSKAYPGSGGEAGTGSEAGKDGKAGHARVR